MKYVKYILLFAIAFFLLRLNSYANTCSYKEQTTLNNDLANIKVTYEVVSNNEINILIYNITNNVYISYTNPETKEENVVYYNNTNNGKYIINKNSKNIEEYNFKIRSNISSCYGNIISTKKIIKPKYNNFYTLEICKEKGLENHSYCQEFITQEINKTEEEVEKTLRDFLSAKVDVITTTKVSEKSFDVKKVITYSISGLLIVAIIITILLIKKKRSEL